MEMMEALRIDECHALRKYRFAYVATISAGKGEQIATMDQAMDGLNACLVNKIARMDCQQDDGFRF